MNKLHEIFSVPLYETNFPVSQTDLDFVKSQEYERYAYSYMSEGNGNVLAHDEMKRCATLLQHKSNITFIISAEWIMM